LRERHVSHVRFWAGTKNQKAHREEERRRSAQGASHPLRGRHQLRERVRDAGRWVRQATWETPQGGLKITAATGAPRASTVATVSDRYRVGVSLHPS